MTKIRDIAPGEYYHVFNRGAHKTNLFRDEKDWLRFLFLALYCQSSVPIQNIARYISPDALTAGFAIPKALQDEILRNRTVELVSFCIMPNHFHLLVRELEEGGIAQYLQRIAAGYTLYFNQKYKMSGHVFQGRYKSVHVRDNEQLLYLSAYIHRNPHEIVKWKYSEHKYPYSSFQDLIGKNRWGLFVKGEEITEQFIGTKTSNYEDFVNTSTAKMFEEELQAASFGV